MPASSAATRLRPDTGDEAFLAGAGYRLSGADMLCGPMVLDSDGRLAVRLRGLDPSPGVELVQCRSSHPGPPPLGAVDHRQTAEARPGFAELEFGGAASPATPRHASRVYCFQPLMAAAAVGPADDAVRIESASTPAPSEPS